MKKKNLCFVILAAMIFLGIAIIDSLVQRRNVVIHEKVDPTKLTVAALASQEDEFSAFLLSGMQAAAKEYGVSRCLTANSNNNETKEVEFINTCILSGVDGIAMQPVDEISSFVTLGNACDKGLAVAVEGMETADKGVNVVGGALPSHYDLGVCSGQAVSSFIAEQLSGQANIGIICYDSQYQDASGARIKGYLDVICAENPEVVIVDRQDAWVQDMAVTVATDMLTAHPEINIFICANDGGTLGTVMAVKNAGRAGDCFVFGIDCGEQQISMLLSDDNILQAVTAQDAYGLGYETMQYLIEYLIGKEKDMGKTTYLKGTLIERGDRAGIEEYKKFLRSFQ